MDFRDYVEKLKAAAATITADKRFKTFIDIDRTAEPPELAALQKFIDEVGMEGATIWRGFAEFHAAANGFLFQWVYKGPRPPKTKTGSAQLAPIRTIYLPPVHSKLATKFYGQRLVLDKISTDDQVAVEFTKGTEEPRLLYFSDRTGDYHPLRLSFTQYLQALLDSRAMYGWQEFFVDDPAFPLMDKDTSDFLKSFEMLFPDLDPTIFSVQGR